MKTVGILIMLILFSVAGAWAESNTFSNSISNLNTINSNSISNLSTSNFIVATTNSFNIASADSTATLGSLEIPMFSSFVSRGRVFQNETVLEPNVTVIKPTSVGSFSINTWGNMGAENTTFNEVDLTLGYTDTKGKLTYGAGLIEYIYSGQNIANTREGYISATYSVLFNPSLALYYDFKEAKGFYGVASIGHTIQLLDKISATVDTGLGFGNENYNEFYFAVADDAINDWSSGLTLNVSPISQVGLVASIRYVDLLDSKIKSGAKAIYGSGDEVVGKVGLTYGF